MSHFHNTALIGASGSAGGDAYQINRSLRFNDDDSAHLSKTFSSAGNRKKWTWSGWVKRSNLSSANSDVKSIFAAYTDSSNRDVLRFTDDNGANIITFQVTTSGTSKTEYTSAVFRDVSAWMHVVLAFDSGQSTASDRVKIYVNGVSQTLSGTAVAQDTQSSINSNVAHYLGARSSSGSAELFYDGYLADVHFIDGQALAPTDFGKYDSNNVWQPKEFTGTYGTNGFHLDFSDNSSDQALGYDATATTPTLNPDGGFDAVRWTGNGSTRTISGLTFQPDFVWTSVVNKTGYNKYLVDVVRGSTKVVISHKTDAESTQSTGVTGFTPDGFTLGSNAQVNENNTNYVAWCWKAGGPGGLNEDGSIDSQVSVSTDYGFSVVTYTGTGSAGATVGHGLGSVPKFILVKNRSATDVMVAYHATVGNTGALRLTTAATDTGYNWWNSTTPSSSVFTIGNTGATNNSSNNYVAYCWSEISGFSKFGSYSGNGQTLGPTVTTGFKPRLVAVKRTDSAGNWTVYDSARDLDKDLKWNTNEAEGTAPIIFNSDGFQINYVTGSVNVSGGSYVYMAFADRPGNNWTTNNLIAEAGLETASQGMDVVTYTGTGSTQSISSLAFQPDLVWLKRRNATGNHNIQDVVRGASAVLQSDYTGAEFTSGPRVSSFDTNGFTLTGDNGGNASGGTYVAWCWKAGGTASSNTDGSITSSVSANQTYGFSIVSYTGNNTNSTVGHGLNAVPRWVVVKSRSASSPTGWMVKHSALQSNYNLALNLTDVAWNPATNGWIGDLTSSTTFSLVNGSSNGNNVNQNGVTYIAYCWSEVSGFSKFGSYESADPSDVTVDVGFKPKFVIIKSADYSADTTSWMMYDSTRLGNSTMTNALMANKTAGEGYRGNGSSTGSMHQQQIEFTDTGFIVQGGGSEINEQTGNTYIYAAFASKPPGELIDSLIDTPTSYEADSGNNGGNYATLNPLQSGATLSDGNLYASAGENKAVFATIAVGETGKKFYWEATINGSQYQQIGIADIAVGKTSTAPGDSGSEGYIYLGNGAIYHDGSTTSTGNPTYTTGDIIGVKYDDTTRSLSWNKNGGSFFGTVTVDDGRRYAPVFGSGGGGDQIRVFVNFGQRPFAYTPPTGHVSLCTTNLTDPTIADGSTAMQTKLWTGDGSSTRTISGYNHSPDWVWIKNRSLTGWQHVLYDQIRGGGTGSVTRSLSTDSTRTEASGNDTNHGYLSGFTSDGFNLVKGSQSGGDYVNHSGNAYVGWSWDAGASTATNNDGSIAASVRVNQSAGFSIANYTGSANGTVGHGLNAAPEFIIAKSRDVVKSWVCYHKALGKDKYVLLNSTNAAQNASGVWGSAEPTSSVFGLENSSTGGNTHGDIIAYCFAPVAGYSSFGSYTGNGSSDGTFVYTGFRVAWLMTKRTDTAENWEVRDSTRNPHNRTNLTLFPHTAGAEDAGSVDFDLLSNGFKLRNTNGSTNASGGTYIYMAFAENPFKTARAR